MPRKTSRKDKLIKLVAITHGTDENDDPTETKIRHPVNAEKKSIKVVEFYQAAGSDVRPEVVFVVWAREYQDEMLVEYDPTGTYTSEDNVQEYNVIRTYRTNAEDIELTCSGPGPRARTR